MGVDYPKRIEALRGRFEEVGVDAALICHRENVAYLCGFDGSAGWLLVLPSQAVLFTDSRYTLQAEDQAPDVEVRTPEEGIQDGAVRCINDLRGRPTIAFEANVLPWRQVETLRPKLNRATLVAELDLVEKLRQVKDADELSLIRQAVAAMDAAYQATLATLRPGMRESDFALELEYAVRRAGHRESFTSIVASGPRSAMPHAQPTDRVMEPGDFLKVDCGARVGGYCSDMTRTVSVGEPADPRQAAMYQAVRAALVAVEEAIRPGATGKDMDAIARKMIGDAGFGDSCYDHGLGHAIGREVHENPRLAKRSDDVLRPGMVMTVEPGIYIGGLGGVRIEDMVYVTEDGCEVLTQTPKPEAIPCVPVATTGWGDRERT
ncbi:MAG TPA: Xaa-Pro peptidase family protein [Armatimonadota bacterium]|nr:Xaa-Pro peptidase family protein [Armatimonadota bacterium]